MSTSFAQTYLREIAEISAKLDVSGIERLILLILKTKEQGGRLFILGVGGSAANASHAACDFRKVCGIEAYAPTDNIAELTARANDEGWSKVFAPWLKTSKLNTADMVLVFSVGGGDKEKNISPNLVDALEYAKEVGCMTGGITGPRGGFTVQVADAWVAVPEANPDRITPHSESFQAVIWHLLVSDPRLKAYQTKWESLK